MTHTENAIEALASAFAHTSPEHKQIYRASLDGLVALAIAEHAAAPIKAMQADIVRVDEIRRSARTTK